MPGMRAPMGGIGPSGSRTQTSQGTMGILMPLYTIGIVIFFVYTIMKARNILIIVFKLITMFPALV